MGYTKEQLKAIYMSREVDRILENKVYSVKYKDAAKVQTKNGLPLADKIERVKFNLIKNTIGIWRDEIVNVRGTYPKGDSMVVEAEIDVVVLNRTDYIKLKRAYEQLSKTRTKAVYNREGYKD